MSASDILRAPARLLATARAAGDGARSAASPRSGVRDGGAAEGGRENASRERSRQGGRKGERVLPAQVATVETFPLAPLSHYGSFCS